MTLRPESPAGRSRRDATFGAAARWARLLLLVLLLTAATGCARTVVREQVPPVDAAVWLEDGASIGQTFVAHHDGLAAVEVRVMPEGAGGGELTLRLADSPDATGYLAEARAVVDAPGEGGWLRLAFAPQRDSRQRYYCAKLTYSGPGRVRVATAPGDAYLHGALVAEGAPQDAQLAFRLAFDRPLMLAGLAAQVATAWLPIGLAGAFILLLPGFALLALLSPVGIDGAWRSWPQRLGLAAGLSVALHPLLFLFADLARLPLGPAYPWAIGLASLGVLVVRAWRGGRPLALPRLAGLWRREGFWPDLTLVGVLGLVVVTRLLPIGALEAPMWGDALQHTMIAQLLSDHGGLFQDWRPYAELSSFSYHYGFHALVAALHWLVGLTAAEATLWMGQMLNVLAALALYPLAARVGGSRWAGVGAVLVAGLLSSMPMAYLNWGRYTQLAGQVVLPAVACLFLDALDAPRADARRMGLAVLALAGLCLTHYRVLLLGAPLFVVALVLPRDVARGRLLGRAAILGGAAFVLALPWYRQVLTGRLSAAIWGQVVASVAAGAPPADDLGAMGANLTAYLPAWVSLALPLCIGWSLWRRERWAALVALWWLGAFLLVNPQLLGLPGAGTITNFALFIALYIPAGVFLGSALGWLVAAWRSPAMPVLAMLLALAAGAWGATDRLAEPNPSAGALVTRPDVRAAAWIAANTPTDARFLVNAFSAYEGSSVVGSDAGWWLPLLAGRATTLPPLNYVSEEGPRPDYVRWVNGLTAALQGSVLDEDALAALREHGVTHVYVGQRHGRVNDVGPDVLDPVLLADSPLFRAVYHQDRVWVFEFLGR